MLSKLSQFSLLSKLSKLSQLLKLSKLAKLLKSKCSFYLLPQAPHTSTSRCLTNLSHNIKTLFVYFFLKEKNKPNCIISLMLLTCPDNCSVHYLPHSLKRVEPPPSSSPRGSRVAFLSFLSPPPPLQTLA